MNQLDIAYGVALPEDYVTKTAAICAQRRKGKTYTAAVIAEELVRLGHPWVAFDPTSAWWGLRASADGRSEGLPVVIFGGDHGDLPLERDDGTFIADIVIDNPGWYIVDLSLLGSRAAEREFAADFAERIYRRKSAADQRTPLHFFVDEADLFAPQDKETGDQKMLGAFQAIVRRGGILGLGCTLITQRPALLNKSVLTQLDLLILLRLVAGNDQDAVDKNYIQRAGSKEQRAELMGSLASLALGEAWLWEPGSDPALFVRAQIRERQTFNSSATPKVGEVTVEPTRLADVDIAALKDQMAATIERAKADDPAVLRRRIVELEQRPTVVERVEVPVPTVPDGLAATLWAINQAINDLPGVTLADVGDWRTQTRELVAAGLASIEGGFALEITPVLPWSAPTGDRPALAASARATRPRQELPVSAPARTVEKPEAGPLGAGEKKILTAVAQHAVGVTRDHLTILTGYKATSRNTYLQRLAQKGYIEVGPVIVATAAGVRALGPGYTPLPTGEALRRHWLETLGGGERAIFGHLLDAWPDAVSRDTLSSLTEYKATSRNTYLQRLRARQLITVDGNPRAVDALFQ